MAEPETKRVLSVDDDSAVLRIMREALQSILHWEIDTSPKPECGFELALKETYDLMIFDFSMPDGERFRQKTTDARFLEKQSPDREGESVLSRAADGVDASLCEARRLGERSFGLQLATSFQPVVGRVAGHPILRSPFRDEVSPHPDLLVSHRRGGTALRCFFGPRFARRARFLYRRGAALAGAFPMGYRFCSPLFRGGWLGGFCRAVAVTRFYIGRGGGVLRRRCLFRFF